MRRSTRTVGLTGLRQAFDEVRFGEERTLNLRDSLPTPAAATTRTEAWLRQQQVDRGGEVLIVTGRGNRSYAGVSVVREAVLKLLHTLKRKGVVSAHAEYSPGSFVVTLSPISAQWESPARKDSRGPVPPPETLPSLDELDDECRTLLRHLAERALEAIGIKHAAAYLHGEMLTQFSAIACGIRDGPRRDGRLKVALRAALDQYE